MENLLTRILKSKKPEPKKPLWETDFSTFVEGAGEKKLNAYIETLQEGREIDFTNSYWGHAFNYSRDAGAFAKYGHGFYGGIISQKKVTAGDFLLLKMSSGKIGKNLVLNVDYCRDPNDMFWAYIVCVGYKE